MRSNQKTRLVLSVGLFLIFVLSTAILLKVFFLTTFFDFETYYVATSVFAHGGNPYMLPSFPFPYPPPALLLLLPFTWFTQYVAGKLFLIISLACLLLAVFLMLRLYRIRPWSLLGMLFMSLVFNFFPTKFTLANGQINMIILLFVVLFVYWYKSKRLYLSGGALAFAISLKLYPALLVIYLIIHKQWKVFFATSATLVCISIIAYFTLGPKVFDSFFTMNIPVLLKTGGGIYYFDQSLSAFIARTFRSTSSTAIAHILSLIILIVTFYLLWLYRRLKDTELLGISIVLNLNLILNNFAWQHHFVWLLVSWFVTFFYIYDKKLNYCFYGILGICYLLLAYNIKRPATIPVLFQSHIFYGAALLFILDMYLLILRNGKQSK